MAVQRRLAELKHECTQLGCTVVQTGKREAKKDFVKALQFHHLEQRYGGLDKAPVSLQYMLGMESPMLCFRLPNMKLEFQLAVWDDPEWTAEEKVNGCRMLVIYNETEGLKFYSRNLSLTDYLPVEYKNIWLKNFNPKMLAGLGITSFILDTEILCPVTKVDTTKKAMGGGSGVITETNLQATTALMALNDADSLHIQQENDITLEFHCFHILELNGNSFVDTKYSDMRQVLEAIIDRLVDADLNVRIVPGTIENKKAFYEKLVAVGGEGVILKKLDSTYHARESRHHKVWLKAKRTLSFSQAQGGLGDTIDGWITGFQPGDPKRAFSKLIGHLEISCWLTMPNGEHVQHHIANVPNLTLEFRKKHTLLDAEGKMSMTPELYNKVVEIDGQWVSARAKRLVHPRLVGFRDDRSPETCVMTEEELNSMIV